jgi:hypothetical protein
MPSRTLTIPLSKKVMDPSTLPPGKVARQGFNGATTDYLEELRLVDPLSPRRTCLSSG